MADPARIECKHAMYSIIQYSKFPWVKKAIELNPHDSDYFFWLDAGGSRLFDGFDISEPVRQMLPEDDFQDWFDISQLSKQFKYIDKDTKVIFVRNRIPRKG